jgi:hypothetical protein
MKIFMTGMALFFAIGAANAKPPKREPENMSVAFSKIRQCLDQLDDQSTTTAVDDDSSSSSEGSDSSEGEDPVSE